MSQNAKVHKLILDGNDLYGENIVKLYHIFKGINILRYVSFRECNLRDHGARVIFEGLERNITLQHLDLYKNNISKAACMRISDVLSNENCPLVYLDVSSNRLEDIGG